MDESPKPPETGSNAAPITQEAEAANDHQHPPQLSDEIHGASIDRKPHDDTALEVDIMLLDFLAYHATETCLAMRSSPGTSASQRMQGLAEKERLLVLVEYQLGVFKLRHASYQFDKKLQFRLMLLELVALFTQRHIRTPSTPDQSELDQLRLANQARARRWIGSSARIPSGPYEVAAFDTELPLAAEELADSQTRELTELGLIHPTQTREDLSPSDDGAVILGRSDSLSLLDLLPAFVQVTAAFVDMLNIKVNETWMELVVLWMQQACVEQYRVYGSSGTDAIDEAFAWGATAEENGSGENGDAEETTAALSPLSRDAKVDAVFTDVAEQWQPIRDAALAKICRIPSLTRHQWKAHFNDGLDEPGDSREEKWLDDDDDASTPWSTLRPLPLNVHLRTLSLATSIRAAEDQFADIMQQLLHAVPEPVILQLAKGQLSGMTQEETIAFVESCGVDPGSVIAGVRLKVERSRPTPQQWQKMRDEWQQDFGIDIGPLRWNS